MYLEHILYSAALAIVVGTIMIKYGRKDMAWLIIPISLIPDIDHFNHVLWDYGLLPFYTYLIPYLKIGMFHTFAAIVVFTIIVSIVLWKVVKVPFYDAVIYSAVGYTAHLLEDYFVYPPAYPMLYPFTTKLYGNNFIPETGDIFGVAGTQVLGMGLVLLMVAIGIRFYSEDSGWIKVKDGEEE